MHPAAHKYLDRTVPRYTSYPSALAFHDGIGPDAYGEALTKIGADEPISLYIHVPYCAQLCWYCGCNMKVENRYERIAPYLDAVKAEIAEVGRRLQGRGRVTQLHFGGGTPNYLKAEDLAAILDELGQWFPIDTDTKRAIELDPRQCTPERIAGLAALGFTRMSLGVQDFDADVQVAINRVQPVALIANAMAAMRKAGVSDISFDLLYGLPRQRLETFNWTLDQTLTLGPDRVCLFGYAHLPARIPHQKLIRDEELPDNDTRAALAQMARRRLAEAGYQRIGFDHFARHDTEIARAAREGRLNRNFQGFTEDPAETVLAFGPTAIGSVHGLYVQNDKSIPGYVERITSHGLATAKGVQATEEEQHIGRWIRELLCRHQGSLNTYFSGRAKDTELRRQVMMALAPMVEDGLVAIDGDELRITEDAHLLSRAVAAVFDPAVKSPAGFASPAV